MIVCGANAALAQTVPSAPRLAMRAPLAHEAGMTAIGILGVRGRMGRAIGNAAAEAGATIAGGIDRDGFVHGDHDSAEKLAAASDVLVDFTAPDALQAHLDAAVAAGTPIVVGTTGLTPDHHRAIDAAAAQVAVLQTANTSLGINLLRGLVEEAARRLGPDWDIEILEMHHRHKLDSPSGTALLLGASANAGRGAASRTESTASTGCRKARTSARRAASIMPRCAAARSPATISSSSPARASGSSSATAPKAAPSSPKARSGRRSGSPDKPAGRYTMKDVLGL